jgi:hypothetical protein
VLKLAGKTVFTTLLQYFGSSDTRTVHQDMSHHTPKRIPGPIGEKKVVSLSGAAAAFGDGDDPEAINDFDQGAWATMLEKIQFPNGAHC